MARMVKKSESGAVTTEKILEVVLDMNERMVTKDDLERVKVELEDNFDKKLGRVKSDLIRVIEPISKAVDIDAETIVKHEKRITLLERKVGMTTK